MNQAVLNEITSILRRGTQFLIATHMDPDVDGIGSMLALGRSLDMAGKETRLLVEQRLESPCDSLSGAERVVNRIDFDTHFDAIIVLDCGKLERVGTSYRKLAGIKPMINIDHHQTNNAFGDLSVVDAQSSSTAELVYQIIQKTDLPFDQESAENIFAALQADTGSFKYENTTPLCLKIAAEMIEMGVRPWDISLRVMDSFTVPRLNLLKMGLAKLEFPCDGRIGMMTITRDMFEAVNANSMDSEHFVNYPRYVPGVQIAVLIKQTGEKRYKFSLRSNSSVNVANLASQFNGGGHAKAAGFECEGSLDELKRYFILKASQFTLGGQE